MPKTLPGLSELAHDVFVYEIQGPILVNAGIVIGSEAVAVIDTGTVESDARQLLAAVVRVSDKPVCYVINTHYHGDHSFGNWWFLPALIVGQARCRTRLIGDAGESHKSLLARFAPIAKEQIDAVPVVAPELTFDDTCRLHLGDLTLRLEYFGRAHTDNDIVIAVEERRLSFAGDLIEESGPPIVFEGFPGEWGPTLRRLEQVPESRFIPGHGREVDRTFVAAQRQAFEQLAQACASADNAEAAQHALSDHVRAVLGQQAEFAVRRWFETAAG